MGKMQTFVIRYGKKHLNAAEILYVSAAPLVAPLICWTEYLLKAVFLSLYKYNICQSF